MRKLILLMLFISIGTFAFALDLKVAIPFDFAVGNTTVPAGQYFVTSVGNHSAMRVRNFDMRLEVLTLSRYAERITIPEVTTQWTPTIGEIDTAAIPEANTALLPDTGYTCVFTKYGDKYFLTKVWYGLEGREIPESKLEKDLRASGSFQPQTVVLIATAR